MNYTSHDFHVFMQKIYKWRSPAEFQKLYAYLGYPHDFYVDEKFETFQISPALWFCNLDSETQQQVLSYALDR